VRGNIPKVYKRAGIRILLNIQDKFNGVIMNQRTYGFAAGTVLIIASILFFVFPFLLNYDAFIPFLFALVSFILGVGFFFMGYSQNSHKT
jgi:hypothetical protein